MPSITELEAAIQRDPDDLELLRVYADALQEAGDSRGEHIALAFLATAGDAEASAKARVFEREAEIRLRKKLDADYVVRLTWHLGFVVHVVVDSREEADKFPRAKLRELIEQRELLTLRGLDLRGVWNTAWSPERQLSLLPTLVEGRPIRWLGIGDGPIRAEVIQELRKALPNLTGLGLLTTKPKSASTALYGLRRIELGTRKLASTKVVSLALASLPPDLERLVFHGMDDRITADAFKPILQREAFGSVRELGVFGPHGLTWDLLRALVDSPLLPELRSLGVCAAELWDDDESQTWLKDNAQRFAHVRLFTSETWPDEDTGHESGRLGQILKKLGRHVEAVTEIEHHLQFSGGDEDHYGCWEELAEAMVWAGWAEEALVPLATGIRLFDNRVDSDSIYTYRTRIEALDSLGRWEEARETCVRALAYEDDNSWTHRHHGRALRELGRLDEALAAFAQAINYAGYEDDDEIPDVMGWAYVEQGRTQWQLRRYDAAIATFAKARLRGDRTSKRGAWWSEGAIHNQRGDRVRAHACLQHAVELTMATDLESPYYELGEILFELGRVEDALAVWKRGPALFPSWVDIEEQGYALLALGRSTEALATVETARRAGGAARALILHAVGRTDEAIQAVDDLAHRPGMPDPVCVARHAAGPLLQGAFHLAAGRVDEGRELIAKALRPARDPRELHAVLLAELGGEAPGCNHDVCGRPAALAAIAAALALGDREDARARVQALAASIEAGSARLMAMRVWDVRGALPLLGVDVELAERAADAIERCSSEPIRSRH